MKRVGLVTEQLRRPTPGGIGRYASALRHALQATDEVEVGEIVGILPPAVTARLWAMGLPARARTDVVHATSFAFPRTVPARPTTVFVHDVLWRQRATASLNRRGVAFHERGLQRTISSADRILVPSASVAATLALDGVATNRIVVTGEGSDHLPARPRRLDGAPVLLSVGTVEPRKNLSRLLAAFASARDRLPEGTTLQLVGSDAWRGAPGLPSDLPAGVEVLGLVDDDRLADLYAGATAFVYPSLGEGYGLPPLEAMRAGVPLISAPVPSIVEPNEADTSPVAPAQLVDPLDIGSIAEALVAVLTGSDRRLELAAAGSAWAASRTWADVAQRHLDVWRQLW